MSKEEIGVKLDIKVALDISKFSFNSCIVDAGSLTHKSHHCAIHGFHLWHTVVHYI